MSQVLTSFQAREPGLRVLPPNMERYTVRGNCLIMLSLKAGDSIEVVNLEGKQKCELIAFDKNGKENTAILGLKSKTEPLGIKKILSSPDWSAQLVYKKMKKAKLEIGNALAASFFEDNTQTSEKVKLKASDDCKCLIAAPGENMQVDKQNTPTDLEVFVTRLKSINEKEQSRIPDPIAEPKAEFLVNRRTAISYEIEEGDYIQVIDIYGRQCSDFLAFDRSKLDKGIEMELDSLATRTFMGAAYPKPGLFSKFFDRDLEPVVEVIQDTCGRHDTFAFACTAKFYEDKGYFGHRNCSENFNNALSNHGVKPRKGWAAINFFYNTGIDANNTFFDGESWSRPGDYVLMQASKNLVCASSACPNDIDPGNAWNPTDIFVRIYPKEKKFTKAVGFRMATDSEAVLTTETGFHECTSKLTRNFVDYNGYWLANDYRNHGAIAEYTACRDKAIVMDLSPLRKFEITGPDAEDLMQYTLTRNIKKLSIGQIVYSAMCYENGCMLDDGTLFRLGKDNFRWIGGQDYGGAWLIEQAKKKNYKVWVRSSTDQIHNLAIQGPNSRNILKDIIWTSPQQPKVEELGWFRFTIGRIGGLNGIPVIVSRTGYTGELGFEVWSHPKDCPAVWKAIWEKGEGQGLTPMGLEALDMLRIEAGLVFYGYEFNDQTDPFESGIGFTVALKSKNEDFIGRDSLIQRKANPQKNLVGLELVGKEQAAHGDCVHVGKLQVGVITSGVISHNLNKNLALCRLDTKYAPLGTDVEVGKVDGHQKRIPAKVVNFPFYDPEKKRVRS